MKSLLELIIATYNHVGRELNLERDLLMEGEIDITEREFDEFIHDIGTIGMRAKRFLREVKYAEVKE
tara:strand:+ start:5439 stop:5639 length:201 start_codon:yes stop_codon:yes gene_type:complete